jgi:hypothetical protein
MEIISKRSKIIICKREGLCFTKSKIKSIVFRRGVNGSKKVSINKVIAVQSQVKLMLKNGISIQEEG